MPPTWLRRPLSITSWLILSTLVLLLSPLLLAGAQVAGILTRNRRPPIAARIVIEYFLRELTTLMACGGLWLASGCGIWMRSRSVQARHWQLLGWFVGGLAEVAIAAVDIRIAEEDSEEAIAALGRDGPLLVFSRHAGPADTILLIDRLLRRFDRHPSVVFKEAITLDPSVDLIAHRLPHAVLDVDDRDECEERIQRTTRALGPRGALLLFPEGGNFTPGRRRAALHSLRRRGHHRAAARGAQMRHVMPPVIFAAHTGLGLAVYPREIWRELPIGRTLHTRMWLVPRSQIPSDAQERADWLSDWWKRIDDWIAAHRTED